MKATDECCECERASVRTGANGEPFCRQHWVDAGMYNPGQGYEPTERDCVAFSRQAGNQKELRT